MRIKQRYYIVRIDTVPEPINSSSSSSSSSPVFALNDIYTTIKQLFTNVYGDIGIGSILNSLAVRHYYPDKHSFLLRIYQEYDLPLQNIITCVTTFPGKWTSTTTTTTTNSVPSSRNHQHTNTIDIPVRLRIMYIAGSLRTLTTALINYYGIDYVYYWYATSGTSTWSSSSLSSSSSKGSMVKLLEKYTIQQRKGEKQDESKMDTEDSGKLDGNVRLSPEEMYSILKQQNFTVPF